MIWVATWLTRSMSPQWVMVSSVLNDACAIFSRSDSLCILMTQSDSYQTAGDKNHWSRNKTKISLPLPLSLSVWSLSISYFQISSQKKANSSYPWAGDYGFIQNSSACYQGLSDDAAVTECIIDAGTYFEMMSKYHIQEYSVCTWRMICRGCKHPYSCMEFLRVNRWLS